MKDAGGFQRFFDGCVGIGFSKAPGGASLCGYGAGAAVGDGRGGKYVFYLLW
jgi:hypothetical protein